MNVTFLVSGAPEISIECTAGENLLEVARRAGVAIDAPCSGNGSCGKCRVQLISGQLESAPSRHLSQEEYAAGWRLACCSRVWGDCTVQVPDMAAAYQAGMKTADLSTPGELAIFEQCQQDLRRSGISFGTDCRWAVVTMEAPTLEDTMPDNERLTGAMEAQLGVSRVILTFPALRDLASAARKYRWRLAVKGRMEGDTFRCMAVGDPENRVLAGCALDIGTTTVSMVLTDLESGKLLAKGSCGNGQIRYGADVINRIIQQSRPGGVEKLRAAVLTETLEPLARRLCAEAGIKKNDILRFSIASNTTMTHLLLGLDAQGVRMEPYVPSFFRFAGLRAGDIGLWANPEAEVVLAPNVGSYVGGDITAGTLAAGIWDREEMTLFVDLGTNGEIVFGNREFLMTCACSAGPAFEGGDISCGMRATDGAVESVELDSDTLEPKLGIIGGPGQKCVGLCGSGIIDLMAELFRTGAINARGKFARESRRIRYDEHGMGRFILAFPEESDTGREISLNEVDMDNFIRAKAAIYSAIDTLLQSVGMEESCIERVLVAGGIGSGIHMDNAVRIGMFPDVDREKFAYVGNSALAGAYALAVSREAEDACRALAENMTYLELSACPGYMDNFVGACFLPHTDRRRFPGFTSGGVTHAV